MRLWVALPAMILTGSSASAQIDPLAPLPTQAASAVPTYRPVHPANNTLTGFAAY
jgi:hypothetical protein